MLKDDGPVDGRSGKCERLMEMLEEVLEEGDAALIFTQFREMGHLLERLVTERLHAKVQFLHGGTPAKERDAMIERFQDPANGIRIFILSLPRRRAGPEPDGREPRFSFRPLVEPGGRVTGDRPRPPRRANPQGAGA